MTCTCLQFECGNLMHNVSTVATGHWNVVAVADLQIAKFAALSVLMHF